MKHKEERYTSVHSEVREKMSGYFGYFPVIIQKILSQEKC